MSLEFELTIRGTGQGNVESNAGLLYGASEKRHFKVFFNDNAE